MSDTDSADTDETTADPLDMDPETRALARTVEANADELRELLELLVVTKRLGEDLAPEMREAATDAREPLADLRLLVAGFVDAQEDTDFEPYELGQSLGCALSLGATVGDPRVVETVDAIRRMGANARE